MRRNIPNLRLSPGKSSQAHRVKVLGLACLAALAAWNGHAAPSLTPEWPTWRGPTQDGIVPPPSASRPPQKWSRTENVRWRAPLPDRGNSTPVIAGQRVFITQAIETNHQRLVMCFDRQTGKLLWQAGTTFPEKEETHSTNPYCAGSPATDGKMVVASFASAGVFAYDMEGKPLWKADLGPQSHGWGNASSPLLHEGRCYVFHGPGKNSALYALDAQTGKTIWKRDLPEPVPTSRTDGFKGDLPGRIGSFATPLLVDTQAGKALILGLPQELKAIDLSHGGDLWAVEGLNPLVYASPTWGEGVLVAAGGFFGSSMAVKLQREQKLSSKPERLWYEERAKKNRLGSPVIRNGLVFFVTMDGMAECIDLKTGEVLWTERLKGPSPKGDCWSSPTLVGDRIYAVNQSGDAFVFKADRRFVLESVNTVGEHTNSSFAHAGEDLFLRTWEGLWCLSESKAQTGAARP